MTASPLLITSLSKYFQEHPKEALLLKPLVDGSYPISLRVMDWFITHYSKLKNVLYWIDDRKAFGEPAIHETTPNDTRFLRKFHLYYEYRAQLKSYTKQFFDPFRRHDRISFVISQPHQPIQAIETTAGQLNFFRWAIQNRLLDYLQTHLADVEEAMTQYHAQRKKPKGTPKEPKDSKKDPSKPKTKPLGLSSAPSLVSSVSRPTPSHQIHFD